MLMIIRLVDRIRGQCEEVSNSLASITEASNNNLPSDDESRRKRKKQQQILDDASQEMKGIFSLIPTYALYFGEASVGDLLLPMLMDDFKKLNSSFASLIASDKKILSILEQEKLALMPVNSIQDDFKYAFGLEMSEALPRFSEHMKTLRKARTA
jgi:hypothetical protein